MSWKVIVQSTKIGFDNGHGWSKVINYNCEQYRRASFLHIHSINIINEQSSCIKTLFRQKAPTSSALGRFLHM